MNNYNNNGTPVSRPSFSQKNKVEQSEKDQINNFNQNNQGFAHFAERQNNQEFIKKNADENVFAKNSNNNLNQNWII